MLTGAAALFGILRDKSCAQEGCNARVIRVASSRGRHDRPTYLEVVVGGEGDQPRLHGVAASSVEAAQLPSAYASWLAELAATASANGFSVPVRFWDETASVTDTPVGNPADDREYLDLHNRK